MPFLWSNPNAGQGVSGPEEQSKFQLHAPDIGPLVGAILRSRAIQQEQQQQGIADAFKGITGMIGGIKDSSDTSRLADAVQLSLQGQTKDSAAQADALMQNASPQARLGYYDWTQKQQSAADAARNEKEAGDLQAQKIWSEIWRNYNRGGNNQPQIWTDPLTKKRFVVGPSGGLHPLDPGSAGNDPWTRPIDVGRGNVDSKGRFQPSKDWTGPWVKLTTPSGGEVVVPWDTYQRRINKAQSSIGNPPTSTNVRPSPQAPTNATDSESPPIDETTGQPVGYRSWGDYFDAHPELRVGALPPPELPPIGGGATPSPYSKPSLQGGATAPGFGENGRPIPRATASNVTSQRPGAGPTDQEIAALQSHPEAAPLFDAKYGKGMAAQFLSP